MPKNSGLPTRQQIIEFVTNSDTPAGKREIAREFGLKGQEKIALKALLKDMADEGLIDSAPGRAFHKMGGLPKVTVLRIVDIDGDAVWAQPERWEAEGIPEPRVRVRERGKRSALGVGDRILARTEEAGKGWIAHPMKKLAPGAALMLGVLHEEGGKLWLQGVEKKERRDFPVSDAGGAEVGDLVLAEKAGRPPRITARVTERLGDPFQPRSFSLIAIHKHEIPHVFSDELIAEAERVAKQPLGKIVPSAVEERAAKDARGVSTALDTNGGGEGRKASAEKGAREDLRHLPIVAIDPADARDHDDAIWAARDDDPKNDGGWKAIVAIADVSFYVRPGSLLDKEAKKRGNSVYFPDRVVPMLPEVLSADVCSLKQGVDRAAMVCHLQVDKDGNLKRWRFTRAVIRVAGNIAYEDAQAAMDEWESRSSRAQSRDAPQSGRERVSTSLDTNGEGSPVSGELVETALVPLWECWRALNKARDRRGPLDLDLPERRIVLDEQGRILSVAPRERLDAHKLVEDYMIAANVAAAKALEERKAPVMYRIHEPPGREKLVALKDYLKTFDIDFALGQVIRPSTFNHILDKVKEHDGREEIMQQVLRTQTQAYYGPQNSGHFGLALGSYAHFTSPIRRYADLIVHRSLTDAYNLGPGGLTREEAAGMERIGETISQHERRAMEAERDTVDRYVAAYLSQHVGTIMETRITGVQNFGFFATVDGIGGDGLVPARDLGREYFRYDEAGKRLVGEDSGEEFKLGQRLMLKLVEANPVSGALRFELPDGKGSAGGPGRGGARGGKGAPKRVIKRRGRPANIRHQGRKR
ncbi:ribonuclease R family protein [Sphingosinithalassobacter portus]|uniref:ribonuclease R family protein n=1 Tax=Stakelama portus TaxID=2676234 RepID=UPI000D6E8D9F|nr:RNB domain-containing ribonuclease [Sphingosinithalassobacter portus]